MIGLLASTLPSGDGYVAAAYIVFFALLLVYLTIMGIRLTRMERRLREMQQEHRADAGPEGLEGRGAEVGTRAAAKSRETEVV